MLLAFAKGVELMKAGRLCYLLGNRNVSKEKLLFLFSKEGATHYYDIPTKSQVKTGLSSFIIF
jgi:hypothetical protein